MKAAVLREVGKPLQIEDVQINKPGPHAVLVLAFIPIVTIPTSYY